MGTSGQWAYLTSDLHLLKGIFSVFLLQQNIENIDTVRKMVNK